MTSPAFRPTTRMRPVRPVRPLRAGLAVVLALLLTGPTLARAGAATGAAGAGVRWRAVEDGLAEARKADKPVLVDVYTDWCGWCKRMERTTYADEDVRGYIARSFVPVKLDAEEDGRSVAYQGRTVTYRQFADGFRISGYPTTLFLASDGTLITAVPGFVKPDMFLTVLRYIGDGHYRTTPWETFAREAGAGRP